MKAGFVPILGAEGGEKMRERVPGVAERGHQVVAKTPSVCDRSLCECHDPLPPFLRRVCFEDGGIEATWGRRGVIPHCTGDVPCVRIRIPNKMRHDITDFPEGTGAGLGPG